MLIFPLKKEWYEKIKSGEKTIEYREVKPYWTTRIGNGMHKLATFIIYEPTELYEKISALGYSQEFEEDFDALLQMGYVTKRRMDATISKIEVVDGNDTDLHIDKPVYAIHLTNVRECVC
ncbi:MAG: hypothetical protein IIT58_13620 [Treponema sp.]|nr:hypothetical protein [Treponema sp.]